MWPKHGRKEWTQSEHIHIEKVERALQEKKKRKKKKRDERRKKDDRE